MHEGSLHLYELVALALIALTIWRLWHGPLTCQSCGRCYLDQQDAKFGENAS